MDYYPEPREIIRKGDFPYKFKIMEDYIYDDTGWIIDKPFISKWLEISEGGQIKVKANESGYAWDGCTPKWSLLNLIIVGIPDGHIDYRTMKPFTYYATLVHDALYQYLNSVPIPKAEIDWLFLKMLGDFKLRSLYYLAVKYFGGRGINQKGI